MLLPWRSNAPDLHQLLRAYFLDLGLPDLVWHPGWGALGLIHLDPLALEVVYLLGASLQEPDIILMHSIHHRQVLIDMNH